MLDYMYGLVCKLYTFFSTLYENIFCKKNNKLIQSYLADQGYQLFKLKNNIRLDNQSITYQNVNKYMKKLILKNDQITKTINHLFLDNGLKEFITASNGFNYSIDFFLAYETQPIIEDEKEKHWYANHWHFDKPFSKNTLKVIVPLKEISNNLQGGMQIICKNKSNKIKMNHSKIFLDKNDIDYQMIANTDQALIFYPNLCLHRAGEIKLNNYSRIQIMFQLNPSKKWRINKNIFSKQSRREPKFPLFSNIFNNYNYSLGD